MTVLQITILDKEEFELLLDTYHHTSGHAVVDSLLNGENPDMKIIFDNETGTYSLRTKQPCDISDFIFGIIHQQEISDAVIEVANRIKAREKEED